MDATGLVVGIAGLFLATLELLAKCHVDKPDRDTEFLSIRLDLQKLLYNQWAYQVGLHQPGKQDRRLDDPETSKAVNRALVAIQDLLNGAGVVVDYYKGTSLVPTPSPSSALDKTPDTVALTGGAGKRRMERLLSQIKFLKSSTSSTSHQKEPKKPGVFTNLFRKGKWMYGDKKTLEEFINTLEILVSDLMGLLPPMDPETRYAMAMMADEDLEFVADEKALRLYLQEATRLGNDDMADSARRGLILSKLFLKDMDRRLGSIREAYKDTFKWVLESEDTKNPDMTHLPTWLRSRSSGTYWVSGKAGSGKSTLMKYLLKKFNPDDKETPYSPLRDWAGDSKVTVCNFFFKRHGSVDQTSLRGLSQAIVYQILRKHRLLVKEAVPDMWTSLLDHPGRDLKLPTTEQMCKATQRAAEYLGGVDTYFLFLIDGLDEFVVSSRKDINEKDGMEAAQSVEGEEEDTEETAQLVALIDSLAALPHVKMVISSRPTPVYHKKFNRGDKLKMEHLTRGCIDSYIEGKLATNKHFMGLTQKHPEEISGLFKDIAEKSSGIFLWVNLACKSLLNGALGNDNLVELCKRVDELPEDLEDMFKHMLDDDTIDRMHRGQGARVLDFCRDFHLTKALDTRDLGFPDEISEHYGGDAGPGREITEPEIRAQTLARIDELMFRSFNPDILEDRKEINRLVDNLEDRLRMRCGGLLEVQREDVIDPESRRLVVFIHRSVQEFLIGEKGQKYLSDHVGKNWDLQWTRTLYWVQRVADVYSWDRPLDKEFSRSGATVWLPILNSRIWTMQRDNRFPTVLAQLKDLLNRPPNMSGRPSTYPFEVSTQWLKTTTCRDAGPELGQSCLRTAIGFMAPYYPNPEVIFEDDTHLNALIAHSQKSHCTCLPPLLFAIDQFAMVLFTESSEALTTEAEILRELITCLVQRGADFNQPATLLTAGGRALTTTPWQHFLTLFCSQVNGPGYWDQAEFAAQALYAVEEFLSAGAHVTVQDLVSLFPRGFDMGGSEGDLVLDGEGEDDDDHAVTPEAGAEMSPNGYGLPVDGHGKGPAASPNGIHLEFERMDVDPMEVDQQPDAHMDCDKAVDAPMDNETEPTPWVTIRGLFEHIFARILKKEKDRQGPHGLPPAVPDNVAGSSQPERTPKRPAEDAAMNGEGRPSRLFKLEE